MLKELIISIVIIISIFVLNNITENYTKDSIEKMSPKFESIRETLLNEEEPEKEQLIKSVNELTSQWKEYKEELSYYIEHDELEKVDTHLVGLKSNVESEEYEQGVENLDACVYVLDHIEEKGSFLIKNVF